MSHKTEKPSPEVKALSLFLMAYKAKNPQYKEKSKRLNRLWDLVKTNQMSKVDYMDEINSTLESYGGYSEVIEKTVKFYIETTGAWKGQGNDQYAKDTQAVADSLLKK